MVPGANGASADDDFEQHMASQGMVRADLTDLASLDSISTAPTVTSTNGSMPRGKGDGQGEIEELKMTVDYLDLDANNDWEMDMSQVMCINMLASGAFGKVFYGMYQGEDVAVKLMNLPSGMTLREIQTLMYSFKQEIAVWHKLKHPNVVEFIGASLNARNIICPGDALSARNQPMWAIITEYMAGGSLKAYLAKKKRLSLKEILRLALDIARGLEYLHSQNVVHRDLKSENLLMDHNNVVKIADFGVARTEAKNPVDMTCETGTVRWMAPEVIEHKPYTRKVDVYSFGIVLWELCTCELPFKDLSFVQLAYNVVNKDMRPSIPEACNTVLAEMMRECWSKDAERRPDFPAVVQRLEALQEQEGGKGELMGEDRGCTCAIL